MCNEQCVPQYSFATPATFRLQVSGLLDPSWSEELGSVAIECSCLPSKSSVTTLTAHVVDQAALIGLLNRLYGLGLPLISVEYVEIDHVPAERSRISTGDR